jgi:flagellar hook-basal body complex protein FliE
MSNLQIDSVLAQIRSLQHQVKLDGPGSLRPGPDVVGRPGPNDAAKVSFASVMRQGLDRVNEMQSHASTMATQFERGVPGVELSQVMLESQKASVAFRATVEVRNRLVNAYQEIMNMPI